MRSPFDQYAQWENRISHALAVALERDSQLQTDFVRALGLSPPSVKAPLRVVSQQLPGDAPRLDDEAEAERRGLPDICLYDPKARWALAVEAKVEAAFSADQCRRHRRTLERRDFETIAVAVLTLAPPRRLPPDCTWLAWSDVYELLVRRRNQGSVWAAEAARYFEIAERRLLADERMLEAAMTKFTGFHFEAGYTYAEARHLLRLAIQSLRQRKTLRELGIDARRPGRPAITGKASGYVWDVLRLAGGADDAHTRQPHFTVSLLQNDLSVAITLPNGIDPIYRKRLGPDGNAWFGALAQAMPALDRIATRHGGRPTFNVLQRFYRTQRSAPRVDAFLECDPRTALGKPRAGAPKHQPIWLNAAKTAYLERKGNTQVQMGVLYPYDQPSIAKADAIDVIVETWLALKPVVDLLRG